MKLSLCSISIFLSLTLRSQITFEKVFDRINMNEGNRVIQTNDGGYLSGGYANDSPSVNSYLVKTDAYGNLMWSKRYAPPIPGLFGCYYLRQNPDGGYISCGGGPAHFIRTNSLGDTVMTKTYPGMSTFNYVLPNAYGFIAAGFTKVSPVKTCITQMDTSGKIIWSKKYANGSLHSICSYANGYIVVGRLNGDLFILNINTNGDTVWAKTSGSYQYFPSVVMPTDDAGFIIGGWFADSIDHSFLLKLDSNGNQQWNRSYGVYYHIGDILPMPDNGYIVSMWSNSQSAPSILSKVDSTGDFVWGQKHEPIGLHSKLYRITPTSDSGFVLIGSAEGATRDLYLVKCDSIGRSFCNDSSIVLTPDTAFEIIPYTNFPVLAGDTTTTNLNVTAYSTSSTELTDCPIITLMKEAPTMATIRIYPNPATSKLYLEMNDEIAEELKIYGVENQLIQTYRHFSAKEIDLRMLTDGVYILTVKSAGEERRVRFIKM